VSADDTGWLCRTSEYPDAGQRLVCFPHAGGSASFFRNWAGRLPGIEVHAVRYPGRAERIGEAPPTDLRQLGVDIATAIRPLADRPISLFGHSMGAAVALEAARELQRGGIRPAHLFASGSRDAELPPADQDDLDEDPDAVAARLTSLGGTDADMTADSLFRELVLPYVMSDGRMFHAYAMAYEPVLACPVTTIVGVEDEDADRRPWRTLTAGAFHEVRVPGNHFYLVSDPPFELVAQALAVAGTSAGAKAAQAAVKPPGPEGVST
jgi:pyochelin biosynthetic protein PchC